jgi:P27 family predicted phage terminase small subunit
MPDWYTADAKGNRLSRRRAMWRHYLQVLEPLRVLTEVDGEILAQLCLARIEQREHEATLAKEGATYETISTSGTRIVRRHPAADLQKAAARQVNDCLREFGLTPVSRTRVRVAGVGGEVEDDFEAWERRRRERRESA